MFVPPRGATGNCSLCELSRSRTFDYRRQAVVTGRPMEIPCHITWLMTLRDEVVLKKSRDIGPGFKAVLCGSPRTTSGVGVIVSERFRDSIVSVERSDDRLMKIDVAAKERFYHFFSAYAPQTGCSDQAKEEFWSLLDEKTAVVPSKDVIIVAGNLNGHVGATKDGYGCHVNTVFRKRDSHLISFYIPPPPFKQRRGKRLRLHYLVRQPLDHRASPGVGVVKAVKTANGRVLRKPIEVRERWEEYFKELLNEEFPHFEAPGKRPGGAPGEWWKDVIKRDFAEVGATADDALDRMRWRQITRTADCAGLNSQDEKKKKTLKSKSVIIPLSKCSKKV
ncbi:unnamed protein product [Heligmosomoides polygyrus]|uniref:Craniofacial development protein 2-like n=1 Tax=Heligmosomoides polygyrus TaxID=6339 RepID=A0A183GAN8_HELPZ|nr:unnamed protein product [Heligmosomoides polygyrus]